MLVEWCVYVYLWCLLCCELEWPIMKCNNPIMLWCVKSYVKLWWPLCWSAILPWWIPWSNLCSTWWVRCEHASYAFLLGSTVSPDGTRSLPSNRHEDLLIGYIRYRRKAHAVNRPISHEVLWSMVPHACRLRLHHISLWGCACSLPRGIILHVVKLSSNYTQWMMPHVYLWLFI